jgi:hypothetical protein
VPKKPVNRRRKKQLAIEGFVILVLALVFGRILSDELKESVDSLTSAENVYRQEVATSATSTQLAHLQMSTDGAAQQLVLQANKYSDYSLAVSQDLMTLQQVRAELNEDVDDVSRLLDALPSEDSDLKTAEQSIKSQVDGVDQTVDAVSKPTDVNDLSRAFRVKMSIIPVAIAEIDVLVFGDTVLKRERAVRQSTEERYSFCKWADYIFSGFGLCLTLYGTLSGLGSFSEAE